MLILFPGCIENPIAETCSGLSDTIDGTNVCIFEKSIIETGFSCPPEFSQRYSTESHVVCSDGPLTQEDLDRLDERLRPSIEPDTCFPIVCATGEKCVDGGCLSIVDDGWSSSENPCEGGVGKAVLTTDNDSLFSCKVSGLAKLDATELEWNLLPEWDTRRVNSLRRYSGVNYGAGLDLQTKAIGWSLDPINFSGTDIGYPNIKNIEGNGIAVSTKFTLISEKGSTSFVGLLNGNWRDVLSIDDKELFSTSAPPGQLWNGRRVSDVGNLDPSYPNLVGAKFVQ